MFKRTPVVHRLLLAAVAAAVVAAIAWASAHNDLPGRVSSSLAVAEGRSATAHVGVDEARPAPVPTGVDVPTQVTTLTDGSKAAISMTLVPANPAAVVAPDTAENAIASLSGRAATADQLRTAVRTAVLTAYAGQVSDVRISDLTVTR